MSSQVHGELTQGGSGVQSDSSGVTALHTQFPDPSSTIVPLLVSEHELAPEVQGPEHTGGGGGTVVSGTHISAP